MSERKREHYLERQFTHYFMNTELKTKSNETVVRKSLAESVKFNKNHGRN